MYNSAYYNLTVKPIQIVTYTSILETYRPSLFFVIPSIKFIINVRVCINSNEPWHIKTNNVTVCPAKTQISLGIRPVWSESSLCAQWVAKDPSFQTGRMPRLIWVFAGRTLILLVCHEAAQMFYTSYQGNTINQNFKTGCKQTPISQFSELITLKHSK